MSTKYPGGFITKSPVAPTATAASGVWTLDQQQQAQKAGTWPSPPMFIEDLFSTWLYTGNGSTQTITNGIDLAGKGGLVWQKSRDTTAGYQHVLYDTVRGSTSALFSSLDSDAVTSGGTYTTTFSSTGFQTNTSGGNINQSGNTQVSWTFREQPKFFDIVTYTGNGDYSGSRLISHNLGTRGGAVIVKPVSATGDWKYTHINGAVLLLNSTEPRDTATTLAGGFPALNSSTDFALVPFGGSGSAVNANGVQYVAYLFAHNAGGFPASGTGSTNGITCGSFTTDGSGNATVDLGYEPQWVLYKPTANAGSWRIMDTMRSNSETSTQILYPNTSAPEASYSSPYNIPKATGIVFPPGFLFNSEPYIYIAIRRGPMKTPTTGTSVFGPVTDTGTASVKSISAGLTVDMGIRINRDHATWGPNTLYDRLRGSSVYMNTNTTAADTSFTPFFTSFDQDGITITNSGFNGSGAPYINYFFGRAPGFFDEVCYTGTGTAGQTFSHNLGVVPEMMIVKSRSATGRGWMTYVAALGNTDCLELQATRGTQSSVNYWNNTSPTSSVFSLGAGGDINLSGATFVAYLFASCPGVSKVGSYTGTGTTQTINCGFTGGARFVLLKATSTTGDWYVWDSARGIVAGNDPYLALNSTAAEVTNTDWVDTAATGFELSNAGGNLANSNGVSYIFLAIA